MEPFNFLSRAIENLSPKVRLAIQEVLTLGSIGLLEWDKNELLLPMDTLGFKGNLYKAVNAKKVPSLCWSLLSSGKKELYSPDVNSDSRYLVGTAEVSSEYLVLLGSPSAPLGVLDCQHPISGYFGPRIRRSIIILANEASMLLLYDQIGRSNRYIGLVNKSIQALEKHAHVESGQLSPPAPREHAIESEVLRPAEALNRVSRDSRVIYIPLDAETHRFELDQAIHSGNGNFVVDSAITAEPIHEGKHLQFVGLIGAAAYMREPFVAHNLPSWQIDETTGYPAKDFLRKSLTLRVLFATDRTGSAVKSALAIPVLGAEAVAPVHGVLYADNEESYAFTQTEIEYLISLASVIAITLDNVARMNKLHALGAGYTAACVMARNLAHHIGSHALTYVIADLDQGRILSGSPNLSAIEAENLRQERRAVRELLAHIRDRVLFAAIQPHALFGTYGNLFLQERLKLVYPQTGGFLPSNLVRSKIGGNPKRPKASIKWHVPSRQLKKLVSIPHGQLGIQAICAILENLVRNAANYATPEFLSKLQGTEVLIVTGNVNHEWDIPKSLNYSVESDLARKWRSEYAEIIISDNSTKPEGFDILTLGLQDSVSSFTGSRKGAAGNLGMLEIKFCAAYLRGISPSQVDYAFETYKEYRGSQPPLLHVTLESNKLEYRFFVKLPRNVLVITEDADSLCSERKLTLERAGWTVLTSKTFREFHDAAWSAREEIVIIESVHEGDFEWLADQAWFLPYRILIHQDLYGPWTSFCRTRELSTAHVFPLDTFHFSVWWSVLSGSESPDINELEDSFAQALSAYTASLRASRNPRAIVVARWSSDVEISTGEVICFSEQTWDLATQRFANGNAESLGEGSLGPNATLQEFLGANELCNLMVFDHKQLTTRNDVLYSESGYWDALSEPSDARSMFESLMKYDTVPNSESGIRNLIVPSAGQIIISRILEATLTSVFVIDDRIESLRTDKVSDSAKGKLAWIGGTGGEAPVTLEEAWAKRRVRFASEKSFILQMLDHAGPLDDVLDEILGREPVDILLIHQQMLKTLTQLEKDSKLSMIRLRSIMSSLKRRAGRLVVHTSTGEVNAGYVSAHGMLHVPWLSYNEIQDLLLTKGKLELVNSLLSLRGVQR